VRRNQSLSPVASALTIVGIIVCAAAPPAGLILIGIAVLAQRRFRGRFKRERAARLAAARAKLDREKILAAKSLP